MLSAVRHVKQDRSKNNHGKENRTESRRSWRLLKPTETVTVKRKNVEKIITLHSYSISEIILRQLKQITQINNYILPYH